MANILAIAAGGAFGALMRYWISVSVARWLGAGFPYGTLLCNVLGSFLMGISFVLLLDRLDVPIAVRALVTVGALGAFTTFSTFSIETLNLVEDGEMLKALANVSASVILCLASCWAGVVLGRLM